jgi:hypothetical protein
MATWQLAHGLRGLAPMTASLHTTTQEISDVIDRADHRAAAMREQRDTPGSTTGISAALRSGALVIIAMIAACGGRGHGDTYARATDVEQVCCEHLDGPGRDRCLSGIVRVDDAEVARSHANQSTYSCIATHFTCDAQTGRATTASAQAQLDCIEDLH